MRHFKHILRADSDQSIYLRADARLSPDGRNVTLTLVHSGSDVLDVRVFMDDETAPLWEKTAIHGPVHERIEASPELKKALMENRVWLEVTGTGEPVRSRLESVQESRIQYVTIKNLTKNQVFSPPVVVCHLRGYRVFAEGDSATAGLRALAEEGETMALIAELLGNARVVDVAVGAEPLWPGHSTTIAVSGEANHQISVLGMLINSNDGFFALRGGGIPALTLSGDRESSKGLAFVYDAGTEANTESSAHVPGLGGVGGTPEVPGEGSIERHPGIVGSGDLPGNDYGWSGPVAEIEIGSDRAGVFHIPMGLDVTALDELAIMEPSMCAGSAQATVTYSRGDNSVVLEVAYRGMPIRLDLSFDNDPSTPFQPFPQSITDGAWQTWVVGFFGGKNMTAWYDPDTRTLIGTKYDFPNQTPPEGAIPVISSAGQAVCSYLWRPDEDGNADVRVEFRYDRMLDVRNTGGMLLMGANYTLNDASTFGPWFFGGLPVEEAFSFDDLLDANRFRNGFVVATSFEPEPKPASLASKANVMTSWAGNSLVQGMEPLPKPDPCETRHNPSWPWRQNSGN